MRRRGRGRYANPRGSVGGQRTSASADLSPGKRIQRRSERST
jgi:hypothetical protein